MSEVALANNFLEPEAHIAARLVEAVEGLTPAVKVLTAAELKETRDQGQIVPALHVIYGGFRVVENRVDGKQSRLMHTWLVVAVVRNAKPAVQRFEAGQLAARAGAAVMGLRCPNTAGPLLLAPKTPPASYAGTTIFLPLAFEVETHFKAN
jgi:hypothetical protein